MATLRLPGNKLHTSTGRIVYDPSRPGLKRKIDWWCILDVDKEITRYYRWWVDKEILDPIKLPGHNLKQPSWDAHVSIIRGEKPRPEVMHLWKKYHGEVVEFQYHHNVRRSGDTTNGDRPDHYWFVEIECPRLTEIRKEFGMPYDWKLHLTIGRTYD